MQKTIIKNCKKHGETEYILEGSGYYRCKQCRIDSVVKNRQTRKLKLIEHFGGKCVVCGYDRCPAALDFHHLDRKEKEFNISKSGVCRSWKRMLVEAEKCILVCCRCHREIENGLIEV